MSLFFKIVGFKSIIIDDEVITLRKPPYIKVYRYYDQYNLFFFSSYINKFIGF